MGYLAQSAFAQSPASAGLDLSVEIIVRSMPDISIAEYQGTRATLESEGLIPAGTKWPEGFDDLRWEDGDFRYWLRRERPEGIKGPRKQFLDLDWWMVRCDPVKPRSWESRAIEQKTKALADEIYLQSAKGREERSQRLSAYWEARADNKFQAFKSLIPGINRPKRGRRTEAAEKSQGAPA